MLEGIKRQALPQQRFKLTEKEIKILQLLKQGLSNKEIAQEVHTSKKLPKRELTKTDISKHAKSEIAVKIGQFANELNIASDEIPVKNSIFPHFLGSKNY